MLRWFINLFWPGRRELPAPYQEEGPFREVLEDGTSVVKLRGGGTRRHVLAEDHSLVMTKDGPRLKVVATGEEELLKLRKALRTLPRGEWRDQLLVDIDYGLRVVMRHERLKEQPTQAAKVFSAG